MSYLQFRFSDYVFRPSWLGTLITLVCIPVFINLGQWQYDKAQQKQALQTLRDSYSADHPVQLPLVITDQEEWRYQQVQVEGTYRTQYQILLDNQVENERVGYHVITPLQIADTDRYVLVDRGWVPAKASHSEIPEFTTPDGMQQIAGHVWIPSEKYYSLEKPEQHQKTEWQTIWQNIDMRRYAAAVPFDVLPVVIRLDPASQAGGFSRNWPPPADRINTHIGYAYQWFGFAVAALIIYIVVSFRRKNGKESTTNANTK